MYHGINHPGLYVVSIYYYSSATTTTVEVFIHQRDRATELVP